MSDQVEGLNNNTGEHSDSPVIHASDEGAPTNTIVTASEDHGGNNGLQRSERPVSENTVPSQGGASSPSLSSVGANENLSTAERNDGTTESDPHAQEWLPTSHTEAIDASSGSLRATSTGSAAPESGEQGETSGKPSGESSGEWEPVGRWEAPSEPAGDGDTAPAAEEGEPSTAVEGRSPGQGRPGGRSRGRSGRSNRGRAFDSASVGEQPGAGEESSSDESSWTPEADIQVSQDFDKTWQRIEEAYQEKRTLSALVVDRVKGGLVVDIGMQGFVPASHVAPGKIHDLERYVGQTLQLRITDLDRERQRVVLSARLVQEEEHTRRKRETMTRLKVGLITDGVVRRLTDFGAFVDIGGIDGLLHVSEMSWSRVKHPNEVVHPGNKIKVKVLKISDDKKKISLGMRQLLPDPWNSIESQFKVGDMVTGRVARVAPFGTFVHVKDGVEAILPHSEMGARKPKAEEMPQVGDTITAKVIELRPEARKMTLSSRRIQEDQERKEYKEHHQHVQQTRSGGGTTIGDIFGDLLSEWNEGKTSSEDES